MRLYRQPDHSSLHRGQDNIQQWILGNPELKLQGRITNRAVQSNNSSSSESRSPLATRQKIPNPPCQQILATKSRDILDLIEKATSLHRLPRALRLSRMSPHTEIQYP